MTEWLYKATRTKATRTETQNLAFIENFVARSAYELKNRSKADGVWDVALGDTVHMYYRDAGGSLFTLGSYEVALPPADSTRFGAVVDGTALVQVADAAFEERWCGEGKPYDVDPIVGRLTGWYVLHRRGIVQPPTTLDALQHMPTLIRFA
jgi:hypothetical protein